MFCSGFSVTTHVAHESLKPYEDRRRMRQAMTSFPYFPFDLALKRQLAIVSIIFRFSGYPDHLNGCLCAKPGPLCCWRVVERFRAKAEKPRPIFSESGKALLPVCAFISFPVTSNKTDSWHSLLLKGECVFLPVPMALDSVWVARPSTKAPRFPSRPHSGRTPSWQPAAP